MSLCYVDGCQAPLWNGHCVVHGPSLGAAGDKTRQIDELVAAGRITSDEADRQLRLNEAMRYALRDFVGRVATPETIAEAEGCVRQTLDEMVRAGTYVMPTDLALDRVELGSDMRVKVYFKRVSDILVRGSS